VCSHSKGGLTSQPHSTYKHFDRRPVSGATVADRKVQRLTAIMEDGMEVLLNSVLPVLVTNVS
jgi:hypothetical protein